jgi:ribose transport system substrate-binding protein
MKRSLLTIALVVLNGCGGSPHAPEEKYFLIAYNIKVPYWQEAGAGLKKAAQQLQVSAEMTGPDTYDPKEQQAEFQRVVKLKPSGIMISPGDPKLMKGDIDAAIVSGIPVITVDSDAPDSKRLLFIGTNNYQAGLMGGRAAAKEMHGKGNVVVFITAGTANQAERLQGFRDAFESSPQIKIVEVVDLRGDARVAFDRTTDILAKGKPQVDAFLSMESMSAKEVAEVLDRQKAKVQGKIVVSMDAAPGTLEGIEKGLIAATIVQKPFTMAFYGVKILDDLHHHQPASLDHFWAQDAQSPIPTLIDTGATLVDKNNLSRFRQAGDAARSGN